MLQAYSLNEAVAAGNAIPFRNQTIKKGCTAELAGVGVIQLNRCGVYMIECDASSTAAATMQLYKDGVALPQAQSTGTSPSFTTLVQVAENNSVCCPCSSPTLLRVVSVTASTYTNANIVVTKVV